jgi:hypothetical protein
MHVYLCMCGPGSSVGIATGYGLDGPGIVSRWGRDFPHLSRLALGPTQAFSTFTEQINKITEMNT